MTAEQKQKLINLVAAGCPRDGALPVVGVTKRDFRRALIADPSLETELASGETRVELLLLRNVQEAARDPRNWRASTWYLERTNPDRYGRVRPRSVRVSKLIEFFDNLVHQLNQTVPDDRSRNALVACLRSEFADFQEQLDGEAISDDV